jgi:hypothetical protein
MRATRDAPSISAAFYLNDMIDDRCPPERLANLRVGPP